MFPLYFTYPLHLILDLSALKIFDRVLLAQREDSLQMTIQQLNSSVYIIRNTLWKAE
jgi:hypothetical protein